MSLARSNSETATPKSWLASGFARAMMALCVVGSLSAASRFWWWEYGKDSSTVALVSATLVVAIVAATRLRYGRRVYGVLFQCNLLALTATLVLEPGPGLELSGTVALVGALLAGSALVDQSARRTPANEYGLRICIVTVGLSLLARVYFGWAPLNWILVLACAVTIVVLAKGDRRMRYAGFLWMVGWVVMSAIADGVSSTSRSLHTDMSRIDAVRESLSDTALGLATMSIALVGASAAAMRGRPGLPELNVLGLLVGISVRCYRLMTAV